MASSKRLPLQLQKLPASHLQKVRDHVKGLLAAGLQEIPDLNALDEILAANLSSAASSSSAAAGPAAGSFSVGQSVKIDGLTGAVAYNGRTGKIVKLDEASGRYVVDLLDGEQKAFKSTNLSVSDGAEEEPKSPKVQAARAHRAKEKAAFEANKDTSEPARAGDFAVGERVRVGGLNGATDLNGQVAVVFDLDKSTLRYLVEFENGQGQKRLQGKNLTGMGVATGALAAKARMFAQMNAASS